MLVEANPKANKKGTQRNVASTIELKRKATPHPSSSQYEGNAQSRTQGMSMRRFLSLLPHRRSLATTQGHLQKRIHTMQLSGREAKGLKDVLLVIKAQPKSPVRRIPDADGTTESQASINLAVSNAQAAIHSAFSDATSKREQQARLHSPTNR